MADPNTTFTARAVKELQELDKLSRIRPGLFFLICLCAVLFLSLWSYEKFWGKDVLKATVSSQQQQIILLEAQLGPFKTIALQKYPGEIGNALDKLAEEIQRFEKRLSQTQIELDETKARASELENRSRGRSLSEAQKKTIGEMLAGAPKGKVRIIAVGSDLEAVAFMNDIKSVLVNVGESVESQLAMAMMGANGVPRGLILKVKNGEDPPLHAHAILNALVKAGVMPVAVANKDFDPDVLEITIGAKEFPSK